VTAWRFDRLSTFGILSQLTQKEIEQVIGELVRAGALERDLVTREVGGRERTFATVGITPLGRSVMLQQAQGFTMVFPLGARSVRTRPAGGGAAAPKAVAADLLAELRDVRANLARAADVPAYVVAPNRTLEDMAARRPATRQAMLEVHGMGPERFRLYGQPFLDALRRWTGA
jgi:ATP-dependent DNA helicase RecQ